MSLSSSTAAPGGPRFLPRLALLAATAVWGSTFVVVQRSLHDLTVFHLIVYRFALGTILLLPWLGPWRALRDRRLLLDSALLGVLLLAGFGLQTYGLLYTTPSRSAFLTGLSVILVPLFGFFFGPSRPRPGAVVGALLAALGLYELYRPDAGSAPFGRGDLFTIGCAIVFAVYILLIEGITRRHPTPPLLVAQFALVTVLASPSLLTTPPRAAEFTGYALFAIVVMGVLATSANGLLQLYAQRHLSAVETAVILTLEPVIAAVTSVLLGVERWTTALSIGGGLVLLAMLVTDLGGGAKAAAESRPLDEPVG